MSKLFIIGNGFDRAHCWATSYDDFRKYLCKTYTHCKSGDDEKKKALCGCWKTANFLKRKLQSI